MELRRKQLIRVPMSAPELAMAEELARLEKRHSLPEYIRELIRREAMRLMLEPKGFEDEGGS